jgi:hypothetical protein
VAGEVPRGVVNRPTRDKADVLHPAARVRAGAHFQPEVEVEAGVGDDGVRHAPEKTRLLSVKLDDLAGGDMPVKVREELDVGLLGGPGRG